MAFKSTYHLHPRRLPKLDARGCQQGATTINGLQVLTLLATMPVTQAECWRGISWGHHYKWPLSPPNTCSRVGYPWGMLGGVSWGSRLQMAFKSSYHLQSCGLPKLDAGGASVEGHDYKWPLSLLPPAAVLVTQVGCWSGVSWGSRLQMAFKSSYHLLPCRLPKLGGGGAAVGSHNSKMAYR